MHLLCSESFYIQYNAQRTVHENDHTKKTTTKKTPTLSRKKKRKEKEKRAHDLETRRGKRVVAVDTTHLRPPVFLFLFCLYKQIIKLK